MKVLDHGQGAVHAHSSAHIQLAVRAQGHVHLGVIHGAPDITLAVGNGQNGAQGATALDLQGQACTLALEGIAHHRGRGQRTAQGRRGNRKGLMDLSCPLGQVPGGNSNGLHIAVLGNGTYQLVTHGNFSPYISYIW